MTVLLPRIPAAAAERLLDAMLSGDVLDWQGFDSDSLPPEARYASTGGSEVTSTQLRGLRAEIEQVAHRNGFGTGGNRGRFAAFDAEMAALLADDDLFRSGEALRDDVWTFIAVVLAPDIVHWRFGPARSRYLGGIRNTFQRLWSRGTALDRGRAAIGRWQLLTELTEDALVQITERPSIAADGYVARHLAEAWVRAAARHGRNVMEPVMRQATLRLRIRNEVQSLASFDDVTLATMMDTFFDVAAASIMTRERGDDGPVDDQVAEATSGARAAEPEGPLSPESTPKRSWAIWRAR